jgi:hypothetical protein
MVFVRVAYNGKAFCRRRFQGSSARASKPNVYLFAEEKIQCSVALLPLELTTGNVLPLMFIPFATLAKSPLLAAAVYISITLSYSSFSHCPTKVVMVQIAKGIAVKNEILI